MKIYFERSGGFTGSKISASLDTNLLRATEKNEIFNLLKSSNFFNLTTESLSKKISAVDLFKYVIKVITDEEKTHTIEIIDMSIPNELRSLIKYLEKYAK